MVVSAVLKAGFIGISSFYLLGLIVIAMSILQSLFIYITYIPLNITSKYVFVMYICAMVGVDLELQWLK